jgi:DNA-binding transcriptional ArsR family regulator
MLICLHDRERPLRGPGRPDPTRRAAIEKLAGGGMNASALREGTEISQPVMSRHLAVLRGARLVREQRSGRFVNDEVDPDGVALIADG